ncbi:hypothetical protein EG329_011701 [Mollisiaceae sp. DMI_Dod_QoI]|nr:hypothetical protein EG329_011701 [Helotiales sp. DMI_Dod_QoI]
MPELPIKSDAGGEPKEDNFEAQTIEACGNTKIHPTEYQRYEGSDEEDPGPNESFVDYENE